MNTKDDIISVFFKCQISVQNGRQPTTSHPKSPLTIMMPTPHFCHACSVSAVSLGSYNFSGFSLPLTCPSVSALSLCNPYCNRLNGSCLLIPKKRLAEPQLWRFLRQNIINFGKSATLCGKIARKLKKNSLVL